MTQIKLILSDDSYIILDSETDLRTAINRYSNHWFMSFDCGNKTYLPVVKIEQF